MPFPRRVGLLSAVVLLVAGIGCRPATRYRVLTFFFDGVPAPGEPRVATAETAADQMGTDGEPAGAAATQPRQRARPLPRETYHRPYREFKCERCHTVAGQRVAGDVERGLCQRCHPNVPGNRRFVHGPVAVNACLTCHHPHRSRFEALSMAGGDALCTRCHAVDDLGVEASHPDPTGCLDCHDPHGGDSRFFLRRKGL